MFIIKLIINDETIAEINAKNVETHIKQSKSKKYPNGHYEKCKYFCKIFGKDTLPQDEFYIEHIREDGAIVLANKIFEELGERGVV